MESGTCAMAASVGQPRSIRYEQIMMGRNTFLMATIDL